MGNKGGFMKQKIIKILDNNNYKLINLLNDLNVKKINLISCGNSIVSGFSLSSFTKPLLLRNENINEIASKSGIRLERYHFSRPEENNDERTYSWLINDIPLSVINKLNRYDVIKLNEIDIDDIKVEKYYPLDDETTLNKLLKDDNSSTIIIYNGATGSFLDNITRGGKYYFTYGVKRDCTSIEAFLKYIQEMNREQNKKIQVYLCGVPRILGMSDLFINTKIKKIASKYANTTYVENFSKKLFYKTPKGKIITDIHYDEEEYLIANNKIIDTINDNYILKDILIHIDRTLFLLNKEYQLQNISKEELVSKFDVISYIEENKKMIEKQQMTSATVLKIVKKYLMERIPYDFYYIGKENIKKLNI